MEYIFRCVVRVADRSDHAVVGLLDWIGKADGRTDRLESRGPAVSHWSRSVHWCTVGRAVRNVGLEVVKHRWVGVDCIIGCACWYRAALEWGLPLVILSRCSHCLARRMTDPGCRR